MTGRFVRRVCAVVTMLAAMAAPAEEDTAYCRKVRARAGDDAALLMWPKLTAEGIRFPSSSAESDLGPTIGETFQPRIGLSFSPTDAYRGTRLLRAAEADCRVREVANVLEDIAMHSTGLATVPALAAQAQYLESHQPEWERLLPRARERLGAGLITVLELQELRRRVSALERKLQATRGEKGRLEARARPDHVPWSMLVGSFTSRSMELERERARLRGLDGFQLRLRGGAIPVPGEPLGWFGLVEVSYSLGSLPRKRQEERYLEARREELTQARYELLARISETREELRARLATARGELAAVESEVESIRATREALGTTEASGGEQMSAILLADELLAESDRVFLRALVASLSELVDEPQREGP